MLFLENGEGNSADNDWSGELGFIARGPYNDDIRPTIGWRGDLRDFLSQFDFASQRRNLLGDGINDGRIPSFRSRIGSLEAIFVTVPPQ